MIFLFLFCIFSNNILESIPGIGSSRAGYISNKNILSNFSKAFANSLIKSLVLEKRCG